MATAKFFTQDDAAGVTRLVREIAHRRVSCAEVVEDALRRIEAREVEVRAFAHLDPGLAMKQAMERDRSRGVGPLKGIPFAVKDIFDTRDLPTEYGSPIYRGHRPLRDAECVARALGAGAVLIGKTVTSELAHVVLGPTANPVDIRYSPGGSSSGSAAAVAAGFVPLALGTQTGGSTIRPAAYCGVFGFKPSFGSLSCGGVKLVAPSLDTVGLFARNAPDLEVSFRALATTTGRAPIRKGGKRVAVCRAATWGSADTCAEAALARAADALASAGFEISTLVLPSHFDLLPGTCMTLLNAELAQSLGPEYANCRSAISDETRQAIEAGRAVDAAALGKSYELQRAACGELDRLFEGIDAIMTFSAQGEAPLGHANGDSIFNRVWTMLHVPCVNVPAGRGPNGLPLGVQLIGERGRDIELLTLARAASRWIGSGALPADGTRSAADRTQFGKECR